MMPPRHSSPGVAGRSRRVGLWGRALAACGLLAAASLCRPASQGPAEGAFVASRPASRRSPLTPARSTVVLQEIPALEKTQEPEQDGSALKKPSANSTRIRRARSAEAIASSNIVRRARAGGGKAVRLPSLFQLETVDNKTEASELVLKIVETLRNQPAGIMDLVLIANTSEARSKILFAIAKLPPYIAVAAQIAPPRRDRKPRVRIIRGFHVEASKSPKIFNVSKHSSPEMIAKLLEVGLFDNNRFRNTSVELRAIGTVASSNAMAALEMLYFKTWTEITFTARFNKIDGKVMLVVSVGFPYAENDDSEEPAEVLPGPAEADALNLTLDWSRPQTLELFPTVNVFSQCSPMGTAKAIADALAVHTTQIVDVVLNDKDGKHKLLYSLSNLPPGFEAAAQPIARRSNRKARVRVIKNFPFPAALGDAADAMELRVGSATDAVKLAGAMHAVLSEGRRASTTLVKLLVTGAEASSRAMLALETLQFRWHYEITFKATALKQTRSDGVITLGTVILVAAT